MNKVTKSVLSVFCASAVLFSFYTPNAFANDSSTNDASASDIVASDISFDKTPDAFNPELEKQKILELQAQKGQESKFLKNSLDSAENDSRLYVIPGQPLVINFDDGSTITYSSSVSPFAVGNRNYELEKIYGYSVGTARINFRVQNCTVSSNVGGGYEISLSGSPNDINQYIVKSTLATVSPGYSEAKLFWSSLYDKSVRYRGTGSITYIIAGVYSTQSYEMIFECAPNGFPYIVSSY